MRLRQNYKYLPAAILAFGGTVAFLTLPDNNPSIAHRPSLNLSSGSLPSKSSKTTIQSPIEKLLNEIAMAEYQGKTGIARKYIAELETLTPENPIIDYYRALISANEGNITDAQNHLLSLKSSAPYSRSTLQLEHYLATFSDRKGMLDQARRYASVKQFTRATTLFAALFPDGIPTLNLRLEFLSYQHEIPSLWEKTQEELQTLLEIYPDWDEAALLLAKHLQYQNPNDPLIFEIYSRLSTKNNELALEAAKSWAQLLDSSPISPDIAPLYATLANRFPGDMQIQIGYRRVVAKIASMQEKNTDSFIAARDEGQIYLKTGKLNKAEAHLRFALSGRWTDEQALASMGMVYQRKGDHRKAIEYFKQALNHNKNPDLRGRWQKLLKNSTYWHLLEQADNSESSSRARGFIAQAIAINPENPRAYILLGELAARNNQLLEAEHYFRLAIRRQPSNKSLLLKSVNIRRERLGLTAAISMIEELSPLQRAILTRRYNDLQIEREMHEIDNALDSSAFSELQAHTSRAIALNPTSPWTRSKIASALLALNDTPWADKLMQIWTEQDNRTEMRYVHALYLERRNAIGAAIETLSLIPLEERTPNITNTLKRLQMGLALAPLQNADSPLSDSQLSLLEEVETEFSNNPEFAITLARRWYELGHPDRADALYHRISMHPDLDFDTNIQLGELMILLSAFDDIPPWLIRLSNDAHSIEEKLALQELTSLYHLKMGESYEEKGRLVIALSQYRRATADNWSGINKARLSQLKLATALEMPYEFEKLSHELLSELPNLTYSETVQLAGILNESKHYTHARATLMHIEKREDGTAQEIYQALKQAMLAKQWSQAEKFAIDAISKLESDSVHNTSIKSTTSLRKNIASTLSELQSRRAGHIKVGADINAQPNQESFLHIPVEIKLPVQEFNGHLILRIDYTKVDAGSAVYISREDSSRYTTSATEEGLALGLGWQSDTWRADIGSTPVGFRKSALVGGLALRGSASELGWRLAYSRRPLATSALAYAGLKVPDTAQQDAGTKWGNILATGVKAGLSLDRGESLGYWGNLQYHKLDGTKVEDNTRIGILGGTYWRLINNSEQQLRIGLNITHLRYDKNLSQISLWQGDYFSPQNYTSLSLPLRLFGTKEETLSYQLGASINQAVKQQDSPYGAQGRKSKSGSSFGYALEAAIEKRISRHWYIGATADIRRSDFYDPNHFQIYAKYTFGNQWQSIASPPDPVELYSDFE
jgi:cellulose synthase operon protein C